MTWRDRRHHALVTLAAHRPREILALGSGERRMTVVRAIAHVLVLLVLSLRALRGCRWYDAP